METQRKTGWIANLQGNDMESILIMLIMLKMFYCGKVQDLQALYYDSIMYEPNSDYETYKSIIPESIIIGCLQRIYLII